MFELSVKAEFSAAHRLAGYAGPCARCHGHNWEVEVRLRGRDLNGLGMLMDFREIKAAVRSALEELDHGDLNALPAFAAMNPTSENLARYLHARLSAALNSARCWIACVTVRETAGTSASFWSDDHG